MDGERKDISIHAPLTGCDPLRPPMFRFAARNFNPRTPDGVRRLSITSKSWRGFISIHAPLTGCDADQGSQARALAISIHAPLTGCDFLSRFCRFSRSHFNPRTPDGVRPTAELVLCREGRNFNPRTPDGVRLCIFLMNTAVISISIHAPLTGCDRQNQKGVKFIMISIHAPLTGCDIQKTRKGTVNTDFNPRTPDGVRLVLLFLLFH